jgi:hypothetical protein
MSIVRGQGERDQMQALIVQALGYLASALVFAAFYMRTMLPLRSIAIASNVTFLAYGVALGLWPVAILHALLLPLNIIRLFQVRRLLADIAAARDDDNLAIHTLVSALHPQRKEKGTVLFRKGDSGDNAYYVSAGEVRFPELNVSVGAGQLFGEMALLSADRKRTASAVCATDVELYHINEQAFLTAFHQNPSFAFALTHLISKRLLANADRLEAALVLAQAGP